MEIQLKVCVNFEPHLEIEEGNFSYYGDYYIEADDVDIYIDADDLVNQLSDAETATLKSVLEVREIPVEFDVDKAYECMDEGQKARLFNKLLKHKDYNPNGTSVMKLVNAAHEVALAQDKEL